MNIYYSLLIGYFTRLLSFAHAKDVILQKRGQTWPKISNEIWFCGSHFFQGLVTLKRIIYHKSLKCALTVMGLSFQFRNSIQSYILHRLRQTYTRLQRGLLKMCNFRFLKFLPLWPLSCHCSFWCQLLSRRQS